MSLDKSKVKNIIIKALSQVSLFSGLSMYALEKLSELAGIAHYGKGMEIIKEGEVGDRVFIIASGKVKIFKKRPPGGEIILKKAGPYEVIGEMSLFDGLPRSAGVIAEEDAILFYITKDLFLHFVRNNADISLKLMETLSLRLREANDKIAFLESVVIDNLEDHPRDEETPGGAQVESYQPSSSQSGNGQKENINNQGDWYLEKVFTCPLCGKDTTSMVVKSRYIQVENIDEDTCTYYRLANPDYYNVVVCSHCDFAFTGDSPKALLPQIAQSIKQHLSSVRPGDYTGMRTLEEAIETYILAINCQTLARGEYFLLGRLNLRLSCLYRQKGLLDKETYHLSEAVGHFEKAVNHQHFNNPRNELYVTYLIGELYLKLGNLARAIQWFSHVTTHPERQSSPYIVNRARTRWQEAKLKGRK